MLEGYLIPVSYEVLSKFTQYMTVEKLASTLNGLCRPNYADVRSPFFSKRTPREAIIDVWSNIVKEVLDAKGTGIPDFIRELELSELDKAGPVSIKLGLEERLPGISPYFEKHDISNMNDECWQEAIEETKKILPKGRLRQKSFLNVVISMRKSTNWAFPFCLKGTDNWEVYLEFVNYHVAAGSIEAIFQFPCLLGYRTTSKGPGKLSKQRTVWMFPHCVSIIEKSLVDPLVSALRNKATFCMLAGIDFVAVPITKMLQNASSFSQKALGIDFSAYDTSLNKKIIGGSFEVFKYWFQPEAHFMLDQCMEYLLTCNLLSSDWLYTDRRGSMPSGSAFTNICDSVCHVLIFWYVVKRLKIPLNMYYYLALVVMGDDGVWFIPNMDFTKVKEILAELGLTVEESKQTYEYSHTSFCQRNYSLEYVDDSGMCRGVRSTIRTLNGMLSMESFKRGFTPSAHSVRWIMQLENSTESPFYKELVLFSIAGDRMFNLGLGLPQGVFTLFKEVNGISGYLEMSKDSFNYTSRVRDNSQAHSLKTVNFLNTLRLDSETIKTLESIRSKVDKQSEEDYSDFINPDIITEVSS